MSRPRSLRFLLLRHDLALLAFVILTAAMGGLIVHLAREHAAQAGRLNQMSFETQEVYGRLQRGLRDATHAVAMADPGGAARSAESTREIEQLLVRLQRLAKGDAEASAIAELTRSYGQIAEDLRRLFVGGTSDRELQRIRVLGPVYAESVLQRFQRSVTATLAVISARQQQATAQLQLRVNWLLAMMPVPLLLGGALVWLSRRTLRNGFLAPVAALKQAASAISANQLDHRARPSGALEMVELAEALNQMAAALAASRDALIERERQAALGELVPVVAHNIRNPLASIRASAQVLDGDPEAAEVEEARRAVIDTVDRLERWLVSLLNYLAPMQPRPVPLKVEDLCRTVVDLAAHKLRQKSIRVDLSGVPRQASVPADPELCEQMLHGLVTNAIEAAPAGSTVDLLWLGEGDGGTLCLRNAGRPLGFEPKPPAVFEPGPSSKARSRGLGLPFAFKVCEAHGWQLRFANLDDGRTEVRVEIPRPLPGAAP